MQKKEKKQKKRQEMDDYFELIDMTFEHEAYVPDSERLTLEDYDIHMWYLNHKMDEMDISDEKRLELFRYENLHRAWILQGNYVKSNIRRMNNWFSWITGDKSMIGKQAIKRVSD